jgi:nucleoside-diphosphate-sugar epimerase
VRRRRPPYDLRGARFLAADLADDVACARLGAEVGGITHLIYAALHERPELITGWRDLEQIGTNDRMFQLLFGAVEAGSPGLRHVTGTKAYGVHVRPIPIPAREDRNEARDVPNFYWLQEDFLKERQRGREWHWTVFRPQVIFGESFGSAMNLIPAIGAYAALLKADGRPLHFPGREPNLTEAVDADLLAGAIAWAGDSPSARDEAFNITNGDVFVWQEVWPAIADALGMRAGQGCGCRSLPRCRNEPPTGTASAIAMTSSRRRSTTSSACRSSTRIPCSRMRTCGAAIWR